MSYGLEIVLLSASLDCSICREPFAIVLKHGSCGVHTPAVLRIAHATVDVEERTDVEEGTDVEISGDGSSTARSTNNKLGQEQAVRISSCNHIFGRTCLEAWFDTSESNRCPECNQELFPTRHMMLFLRDPTRAMRRKFADCIEHICNDLQAAVEIRENLMSDSTRTLMRELALKLWRQQGYNVDYQYINGANTDGEEADTEIEDISRNNNSDDSDDTDETTMDRHEMNDRARIVQGPSAVL